MLEIVVPAQEFYDERTEEFIYSSEETLLLEHSLISVSKWENKWRVPFLTDIEKPDEQANDYIRCMTINRPKDPGVYDRLPAAAVRQISEYVTSPATATTFKHEPEKDRNPETITAELVYYWMITLNIPFECEKWHLDKLFALIRVCSIKNSPPKEKSFNEIASDNTRLNEQRCKEWGTTG